MARDYNAGQLQKHYRTNTEVPYTYIKDIDFPTMAKFSEHDVGLPGVDIAIKPVRSYVYGALAAHLLGYVGPPDDTNKEEARKFTFYQSDVDGKSNVEKIFDQYLRGKPGVRYLRRNAKGTIDGVLREDPPMQGANVYLTIDARIQAIAEEAIRSVARGAAVVVDPNNGDVLAMVLGQGLGLAAVGVTLGRIVEVTVGAGRLVAGWAAGCDEAPLAGASALRRSSRSRAETSDCIGYDSSSFQ